MWFGPEVLNVTEPVNLEQPGGQVTIVEGSSFCLSARSGDIRPGQPDGLFVLDTRVVSQWELLVDGRGLEPLSVSVTEPFSATFVARARSEFHGDSDCLIVRRRWVGSGMREDLRIENYSNQSITPRLELRITSDFADLFDVKAGRSHDRKGEFVGNPLHIRSVASPGELAREVTVTEPCAGEPGASNAQGLVWTPTIPAKGSWQTCLEVAVRVDGLDVSLQYGCGVTPQRSKPARRLADWRRRRPTLQSGDPRLEAAIVCAVDDVSSLVIEDPMHPDSPVVAAGAPWFMALFGRDSLITSYMSLIVDPSLAVGTLRTLARLQGTTIDVESEEQPGRILHEVRFSAATPHSGKGGIYYGTADATPLFVVLVGELSRWGVDRAIVDELLPHVDRALDWIELYGDRDGDGYVEYERSSANGLANQGWKDSWDGVNSFDGSLATTPIALAEVQGYVYAAYRARADLAAERGDTATSDHYGDKADRLRIAFNRDFWVDHRGWYAMALDGNKQPVDSLASNIGHCLWSGIIDADRAGVVAAQLLSPEMFSGWGVRTLATTMTRYNPLSYHNGSVWPHDSAIAAAGLMRYGFVDEARRVIDGVLAAAAANSGRLPELYSGIDRAELPVPVAYPTSCSPQAWASATPLSFLRTLLRFEPRLDLGRLHVAPTGDQSDVGDVQLSFAGHSLSISSHSSGVEVSGLPEGVVFVAEAVTPPSAIDPANPD